MSCTAPQALSAAQGGYQTVFEELAADTWARLELARQYACAQGEETITDILALDLSRSMLPGLRVVKVSHALESRTGVDFEICMGASRRIALQAKRLFADDRYRLGHKVRGIRQIDLLEQYALAAPGVDPFYCLYNHYPSADESKHWHCSQTFDARQLGCTVAPLEVVTGLLSGATRRGFDTVHQFDQVLPWRCLFHGVVPSAGVADEGWQAYWSWAARLESGTSVTARELPRDFFPSDEALLPRWLVIAAEQ